MKVVDRKRSLLKTVFSLLNFVTIVGLFSSTTNGVLQAENSTLVNDLAWNHTGNLLAVALDNGEIQIVDTTGQSMFTFNISQRRILSIAWSPSQQDVIAVNIDRNPVQVLSIADGQLNTLFELIPEELVRQVAWSPDGSRLATLGETGGGASSLSRVRIWDANTGNLAATYEDYYSLTGIAWNPQSASQLLITGVANNSGAEILLWDFSSNAVVWKIQETNSNVINLAWKTDAYQFASMTETETSALVRIHDAETGETVSTLKTGMAFRGDIVWEPGKYLAITDSAEIQIWDTTTATFIDSFQSASYISVIQWKPNTVQLAYGGIDGTVNFFSPITPAITPTGTTIHAPKTTPTAADTPSATSSRH